MEHNGNRCCSSNTWHWNLCCLRKADSQYICLSCLCQTFARSWLYVRRKDGRPAAWAKTQIDQICRAPQLATRPSLSHPPNLSARLPRPLLPLSDEVNKSYDYSDNYSESEYTNSVLTHCVFTCSYLCCFR